jgi:gluconate 2-dehydrogenase gamma chain
MWLLPEQTTGFLTAAQRSQVAILYNAILPGDAARQVPDAAMAGAVDFIDLLLARDNNIFEDIGKWRTAYSIALQELNKQAVKLFAKPLENISAEESATLISKLENNQLENFPPDTRQADLFDMLRRHCIQGCFCDPRWGGNKDGLMWKWYGYQEETKQLPS